MSNLLAILFLILLISFVTSELFLKLLIPWGKPPGSNFQIWGQAPVRPESILGIKLGRQRSQPSGLPLCQRPVLYFRIVGFQKDIPYYNFLLNINLCLQIQDTGIRDMILHMIQLDPKGRLSCRDYLQKYESVVFPIYFSEFLHKFFSDVVPLDSDNRVRIMQFFYNHCLFCSFVHHNSSKKC
jgi:hypothetical protein